MYVIAELKTILPEKQLSMSNMMKSNGLLADMIDDLGEELLWSLQRVRLPSI